MAVGIAVTSHGGHYNGRITLFVVLSCMMAGMGGVIFGYDIGISGGVTSMDSFLKKFFPEVYKRMKEDTKISNYCKFDSQLLTSFTSSLYIAGLVASFVASWITKKFGRKPTILAGGAAFLIGSALGGAAFNVYMVILGRILLGVGVGFANQAVPLYLSEMAPPRYRGAINNGFQFSIGKILQRKYRPQLVMAIAIPFFQQVTGINVIAFYAPVLFRAIGLGVIDKLGRRVLFLVGGIQMLIRSAGQSITVAVSFIFTFIVAQTFLSMLCHFKSGIFFFFGGWVVLMTAFVYYLLPETKSIPIEQMDRVWKEHWFWKRIVVEELSNPKMETA
ncbi:unnamed protein product, partial [Vitis vinifera]